MTRNHINHGHVLAGAALIFPSLGLFVPSAIAPLAVLTILALLTIEFAVKSAPVKRDFVLLCLFGAIVTWAAASLFWTIRFDSSLKKLALISVILFPCVYMLGRLSALPEKSRRIVANTICIGLTLAFSFALLEILGDSFITRTVFQRTPPGVAKFELFNRASAVLLISSWAGAAVLWQKRKHLGLALLGVSAGIAWILPSASALLAFVFGLGACVAFAAMPRLMRIMIPATMAGLILLAPLFFGTAERHVLPSLATENSSIIHRIQIWHFAATRIHERLIFGWGFNSARNVPGGAERYLVKDKQGKIIGQGDRLPLHPHNGAMQVWLELGLPGAVLFAGLIAIIAYRASHLPSRRMSAFAVGLATTAFLVWLLSFGAWQGWWLSTLCLAAILSLPIFTAAADLGTQP